MRLFQHDISHSVSGTLSRRESMSFWQGAAKQLAYLAGQPQHNTAALDIHDIEIMRSNMHVV